MKLLNREPTEETIVAALKACQSGQLIDDVMISAMTKFAMAMFDAAPEIKVGMEPVATKLETQQFSCFHVSADDFKRLSALPDGSKLYSANQLAEVLQAATLAERDACAQICENLASEHEVDAELENDERFAVYAKHQRHCARAIRARTE